jgi:hypothetical protein
MQSTMRRPDRRTARVGLLAALIVGLAVVAALVWQSSYSAFSSTTDNGVNNWAAGTVAISDNDSNSAMFTGSPLLKPGDTASRCIEVKKTGTLPGTVKLYGSGLSTTNALSSYLDITVEQGSGASTNGVCSNFAPSGVAIFDGTLAGFTATNYSNGYGNWVPAAGDATRVFRFTYTLRSSAPNGTQGGTASINFTWEVQS